MEKFIQNSKVSLIAAGRFIIVVVLPLTIWFYAIKYDIEVAHAKIEEIKITEKETAADLKRIEFRIADKLETIQKDVAEIKGELKRRP